MAVNAINKERYYPVHPVGKPVSPELLNQHQRLAFDALSDLNTANQVVAKKIAVLTPNGNYTVATLPAGKEGQMAFATNGRKVGEGVGNGTGVPVYFSTGKWRVYSTDAQVQV